MPWEPSTVIISPHFNDDLPSAQSRVIPPACESVPYSIPRRCTGSFTGGCSEPSFVVKAVIETECDFTPTTAGTPSIRAEIQVGEETQPRIMINPAHF